MEQSIENFKKTFRNNLKRLRKERGYAQIELSEKSGFEASYVGKLERGDADPSLESIRKICNTLGIPPEEILLRQEELKSETSTEADARYKVTKVELEMQNQQLKQTEQELRTLRNHYRKLYQEAPVPFLSLNEEGSITEANTKFLNRFAPDKSMVRGDHVNEYIHPDDRDDLYRFRNQAINGKSPEALVVKVIDTSDGEHTCRLDATYLDDLNQKDSILLLSFQEV